MDIDEEQEQKHWSELPWFSLSEDSEDDLLVPVASQGSSRKRKAEGGGGSVKKTKLDDESESWSESSGSSGYVVLPPLVLNPAEIMLIQGQICIEKKGVKMVPPAVLTGKKPSAYKGKSGPFYTKEESEYLMMVDSRLEGGCTAVASYIVTNRLLPGRAYQAIAKKIDRLRRSSDHMPAPAQFDGVLPAPFVSSGSRVWQQEELDFASDVLCKFDIGVGCPSIASFIVHNELMKHRSYEGILTKLTKLRKSGDAGKREMPPPAVLSGAVPDAFEYKEGEGSTWSDDEVAYLNDLRGRFAQKYGAGSIAAVFVAHSLLKRSYKSVLEKIKQQQRVARGESGKPKRTRPAKIEGDFKPFVRKQKVMGKGGLQWTADEDAYLMHIVEQAPKGSGAASIASFIDEEELLTDRSEGGIRDRIKKLRKQAKKSSSK